jgi:hypothetical protein
VKRLVMGLLAVIGGLLLAACSPTDVLTTGQDKPPTDLPSMPTALPGSVDRLLLTQTDDDIYAPQDLSRIAATGRPQFILSFANW